MTSTGTPRRSRTTSPMRSCRPSPSNATYCSNVASTERRAPAMTSTQPGSSANCEPSCPSVCSGTRGGGRSRSSSSAIRATSPEPPMRTWSCWSCSSWRSLPSRSRARIPRSLRRQRSARSASYSCFSCCPISLPRTSCRGSSSSTTPAAPRSSARSPRTAAIAITYSPCSRRCFATAGSTKPCSTS